MKIYGAILSPYVCRVLLALRHKGIKHEVIMPEGGMKTPEYLAMNPLGKMPTMKDGATTLPESSVIVEYIDTKYPKKAIIPASAKTAAQARLIATISALYVQDNVTALFPQRDPKTRDKALVKAKIADLEKGLDALSHYLDDKGPWAMGKRFTIADCYALPALFFLQLVMPGFGNKDPLAKHKKVKKYWNALKRAPLGKQALKEMKVMAKQFFGGGK
ncbi:MAG: glutathione S-transferase family protein [Rhodospirillaceae bacterium]|jgi:glutathione S-transferase|nr:glutathione S-transferase family protein [Rhodospirillaceae bacterium]